MSNLSSIAAATKIHHRQAVEPRSPAKVVVSLSATPFLLKAMINGDLRPTVARSIMVSHWSGWPIARQLRRKSAGAESQPARSTSAFTAAMNGPIDTGLAR